MTLTVQGTLWAYCSNLPQGFSIFTEGGLLSAKRLSSPMTGQFKPFVPFMGGRERSPGSPGLCRGRHHGQMCCRVLRAPTTTVRRRLLFADSYFRRRDAFPGLRSRG